MNRHKTFGKVILEDMKKLGEINALLTQSINSVMSKVLLVYVGIFVLLELLAYTAGGIFTLIESRLWLLQGIFCFGFIIFCFLKTMYCDVKNKNFIPVAGMTILLGFLLFFVGNISYSDVNPDATQQMAAGIASYQQSDWNFTGSSFLGYPNRQYVIEALVPLVFGRSIYTLHMGFAFVFFLGIIMMYLGLRDWCEKKETSDKIALIAIYGLVAFRFVAEYFMNFEQAITPISLTMIAVGLFLKFVNTSSGIYIMLMVWLGSFCAGSYTPVLASLGLLLVFLMMYAYDVYKTGNEKYTQIKYPVEVVKSISYAVIGNISITLIILLHTKAQKIEQTREEISGISYLFECIRDFFFDKNAVFFGIFGIVVLIYMMFALTFRLKFYDFIIAVWILAVAVLADYMTGYTTYQKSWILQRTLIVVPVLVAAITIALVPYLKKITVGTNGVLILVVLSFIGMYNFTQPHQSFVYFNYVYPMKTMLTETTELMKEKGLEVEDEFNLVLYTNSNLQTNLECYTRFLYPNAHAYTGTCADLVTVEDSSLPTIIFSEENLQPKYESDTEQHTFYDKRHKAEVIWYTTIAP